MASSSERDQQLLSIGQQCSDQSCLMVDFLPFKCQHCTKSFCQDHFKVDAHKCPAYDESKHNRVAPSCPLCNTPVAIPPNQDPNIRMEQHINDECSVMTGRRKAKSAPICARGKCGKVLFAPISCKVSVIHIFCTCTHIIFRSANNNSALSTVSQSTITAHPRLPSLQHLPQNPLRSRSQSYRTKLQLPG